MPKFSEIQHLTAGGTYCVNAPWPSIERALREFDADQELDLDPDFQNQALGEQF